MFNVKVVTHSKATENYHQFTVFSSDKLTVNCLPSTDSRQTT